MTRLPIRMRWQSPIVVEPNPALRPRGSRQEALNGAPRWHRRWQSFRCSLGFHYFTRRWSFEHGRQRQFRMCQRWFPDCMTTDYRPGRRATFPRWPLMRAWWRWRTHRKRRAYRREWEAKRARREAGLPR